MVLEWTFSRFGHTFYTKDGESFECPWGFCFPPINMPAHITIDDLVRAEPLPPRELPWSYEADKHLFSEPACSAPPSERSVSPTPSEVEVAQTVLLPGPPSPPRSTSPLNSVSSPCHSADSPDADRYGASTFVPRREIPPEPKPLVLSTAIVKIMTEVTKDIGLRHRAISMVENATGKCYGDVQAFNIPEVVATYLEERAHRLKELVDGFKDPESRKRAYESAIQRWQEAAAAAEKSREAAGKATGKAPKKGRASSKASAKAGSKRNRSEEDEEARDRPTKRSRGGRGSDMSERIEKTRNDPTVKSFGAHHIICAGCDEEIAAEGRRDLYLCSLRNKHKLEKCAGLARWVTQPPSQEDMKAWQAARNKCAEISVYLLAKDRRIHKCQCRRLGAGLEEDRLLRYEANRQRVADGNAARAAQA